MPAPRKPGRVRHLHIDPYVRVKYDNFSASFANDKRLDKTLAWWDGLPPRQRSKLAWELIIAACNGELGVAPSTLMDGDDDATENKSALNELLRNMVLEEE